MGQATNYGYEYLCLIYHLAHDHTGLGTALKILFSYEGTNTIDYNLEKNELVAFFNTIQKLGDSLLAIGDFKMLIDQSNHKLTNNSSKTQLPSSISPPPSSPREWYGLISGILFILLLYLIVPFRKRRRSETQASKSHAS